MNTNWRFRDHRGFQHDAVVVIGAAGAIGALTWALPLAGATWWIVMVVGPLLALLVGQAPRRRLVTVATSALGAVLAGATWHALAGGIDSAAAGDALLVGLLSGLAATSALTVAHLERIAERPLAKALVEARLTLGAPASRSGRWRIAPRSPTTASWTAWAATAVRTAVGWRGWRSR